MFFMFHILVFTILQVSNTHSFPIKREINQDGNSRIGNEQAFNFRGMRRINGSNPATPDFFSLQNLTHAQSPNLKSNIFDKMLSDELLLIKQQIYDKEGSLRLSDRVRSKSNVPTPTLEIKQKWPVIEFLAKLNKNVESDRIPAEQNSNSAIIDSKFNDQETTELDNSSTLSSDLNNETLSEEASEKEENISDNNTGDNIKKGKLFEKVIGLRSLYHNAPNDKISHRRCSCDNGCSSQCTGGSTHKCTRCNNGGTTASTVTCAETITTSPQTSTACSHTASCASSDSNCKRTVCTHSPRPYPAQASYSVLPFYMPFQYAMQGPPENPLSYYYTPNLDDYEYTKPPKRHHSTKRHKVDYYYYDDGSKEDQDDFLEDTTPCIEKPTTCAYQKKIKGVVLKVDYADKVQETDECDGVFDVGKNRFVNEIVDDLKLYYPESVVKDCYCKSSSVKLVRSDKLVFSFCFILLAIFV